MLHYTEVRKRSHKEEEEWMVLGVSKGTADHQSEEVSKRKDSVATACEADEPETRTEQ